MKGIFMSELYRKDASNDGYFFQRKEHAMSLREWRILDKRYFLFSQVIVRREPRVRLIRLNVPPGSFIRSIRLSASSNTVSHGLLPFMILAQIVAERDVMVSSCESVRWVRISHSSREWIWIFFGPSSIFFTIIFAFSILLFLLSFWSILWSHGFDISAMRRNSSPHFLKSASLDRGTIFCKIRA